MGLVVFFVAVILTLVILRHDDTGQGTAGKSMDRRSGDADTWRKNEMECLHSAGDSTLALTKASSADFLESGALEMHKAPVLISLSPENFVRGNLDCNLRALPWGMLG